MTVGDRARQAARARRRLMPVRFVRAEEFSPVYRTRYPALGYQCQGRGNWRFIDMESGSAVGASMATKEVALSRLDDYAEMFGAKEVGCPC